MLKKFNTTILILIAFFYSLKTNGNEGNTTCSKEMTSFIEDYPNTVILKVKVLYVVLVQLALEFIYLKWMVLILQNLIKSNAGFILPVCLDSG